MADVTTGEFNEVTGGGSVDMVTSFNELDEHGSTITDEQVPLSVRLDVADDWARNMGDELTSIEDEETPLAVTKSGLGGRVWWYWILIIISAITGKVAKDKRNKLQKEVDSED